MAREHPRYANFEWPEYEFREFPLMIYPGSADGGKTPDPLMRKGHRVPGKFVQDGVVVNSPEEMKLALESEDLETVEEGGVTRIKTPEDERQELLGRAETAGVKVDKRWSATRIQDAIDSADIA